MPVERILGSYRGRAVVHQVGEDGSTGWIYLITGRSPASRRRRVEQDGGALVVRSIEPGGSRDALRHYRCAVVVGDRLVVGNGDHVDVLAGQLADDVPIARAVDLLAPEPDPPIHTPRIALVLGPDPTLVAVRRAGHDVQRQVVPADGGPATVSVLATYAGSRERPLGHAPTWHLPETRPLLDLAHAVWGGLDPDLRVALVAGTGTEVTPLLILDEHP